LDGASLSDLTDKEIKFLIKESEIEAFADEFPKGADSIAFLSESAKRAAETNLQTAVFYGWAREGTGIVRERDEETDKERIKFYLKKLLEQENKTLRNKLVASIEKNIIPSGLQGDLQSILDRLNELRDEVGLLVEHKLSGELLDEETEYPLVGYEIQVFEPGEQEKFITATVTSATGRFALSYDSRSEDSGTDRDLLVRVLSLDSEKLMEQEVPAGQVESITLKVNLPKEPAPELPGESFKLNSLNDLPEFEPPQGLFEALEEMGAKSLADVRLLSGKGSLAGLADTFGEEPVQVLTAHANLSVVTKDVGTAAKLIGNGYANPLDIAHTPIKKFVDANEEDVGTATSIEISHIARATTSYFDATMTGMAVDRDRLEAEANVAEIDLEDIKELLPEPKCDCGCNHALSPNAYLADLLDYITNYLDITGSDKVTLEFLREHLHQPFDRFPNSCDYMVAEIRQVRIFVEVLRSYLRQNPPENRESVSTVVEEYTFNTYRQILNQLGTSYEEVRAALTDEELRNSLAQKLGISTQHLQNRDLFFTKQNITESRLENRFGFKVTNDPLNINEDDPAYLQWQYERINELWLKEDRPSEANPENVPIIDPDLLEIHELVHPSTAAPIYRERKRFINSELNQIESRSRDLAGLDESLQDAFETTREEIKEKNKDLNAGRSIKDFLATHWLNYPAFNLISKVIETVSSIRNTENS